MKKILIVGGGGYIGSAITPYLKKKKYDLTVIDNFIYNHKKFYKKVSKQNSVSLIDRDMKHIKSFDKKFDVVIILAGLVGDPITKKYTKLSRKINFNFIRNIIKLFNSKKTKLIFVSTCSNYGFIQANVKAKENHKLNPLSYYAKDKIKIEKFLIKNKKLDKVAILRFATAFGASERMRFDLTLNEFVYDIIYSNYLEIYDADTWRPYCHVQDFAQAIEKTIKYLSNKKSHSVNIFNIGSDKNNYTKRQIGNFLKKKFKKAKIVFRPSTVDARNYRVNFSKAKKVLKFKPKFGLNKGINELLNFISSNKKKFKNKKLFGNYEIKKKFL
jgi:nucleoside-diphosphate-sugar epimerase